MVAVYEDNFGYWGIDCPKEGASLSISRGKARWSTASVAEVRSGF